MEYLLGELPIEQAERACGLSYIFAEEGVYTAALRACAATLSLSRYYGDDF